MFLHENHMHQWTKDQNQIKTFSEDYWCETCDKGFQTARLLDNHKLQHQKCNIDGCQFIAHPRIITKHIQMQHSTGLYNKIAKLANPEEVKKWIEERKKKYPTKQNIEKKTAQIKEKIERGERLGLNKTRNYAGYKTYNHDTNFRRQKTLKIRSHSISKDHKPIHAKKIIKPDVVIEDKRKLKPFSGIQNIMMDSNSENDSDNTDNSFDDNDCLESSILDNVKQCEHEEPILCNALSSLIDNYDSLDDETNKELKNQDVTQSEIHKKEELHKEPTKNLNKTVQMNLHSNLKNQHTVNNLSDSDSGPEETKFDRQVPEDVSNQKLEVKLNVHNKSQRRYNKKVPPRKFKPRMPSTLLEKLLFPEMQKERNMVLQCVCYIVKNNYFIK